MNTTKSSANVISELSDLTLLELVNSGDESALSELYERYWEPVFMYVARVLDDVDSASDVVQETFIALWQKRGELGGIRNLKAYLTSIARYKALKELSLGLSEQRHRESLVDFLREYDDSPEIKLISKELESTLEQYIHCLPERMREVFVLSRYEHLSYAEIAQKLNISDKTVKKQISNALHFLRGKLDEKHMWATIFLCVFLK